MQIASHQGPEKAAPPSLLSQDAGYSAGLTGVRVLLVEDEALVAMLIEDFLLDLGCEVIGPASTLATALQLVDSKALDAAVLDVNLGGQMVFPVADRLVELGVPFVFSTGYGAAGVIDRYKDPPVLQKPYDWTMLDTVLSAALARN